MFHSIFRKYNFDTKFVFLYLYPVPWAKIHRLSLTTSSLASNSDASGNFPLIQISYIRFPMSFCISLMVSCRPDKYDWYSSGNIINANYLKVSFSHIDILCTKYYLLQPRVLWATQHWSCWFSLGILEMLWRFFLISILSVDDWDVPATRWICQHPNIKRKCSLIYI